LIQSDIESSGLTSLINFATLPEREGVDADYGRDKRWYARGRYRIQVSDECDRGQVSNYLSYWCP
jgi:hypothetical protein